MKLQLQGASHTGAVVVREVRELARRKTPFVLRSIYALLAALIVFASLILGFDGASTGMNLAFLSEIMFAVVAMLQAIFATGMGVLLGVTTVQTERRNLTLGLLLLSGIGHGEVVLGKLLAQVGLSLMVFFGIIPVLALIGWGGGVDYAWLWRLVLLTLVLSVLGTTIGLAFSMWSRSAVAAAAKALLFTLFLIMLPVLIEIASPAAARVVAAFWIWNPALAVSTQGREGLFLVPLCITAAIALVMGCVAVLGLRRAASAGNGKSLRHRMLTLDRWIQKINPGKIRLIAKPEKLEPEGNPVAWLTRVTGGMGWAGNRIRFFVLNLYISGIAGTLCLWKEEWGATLLVVIFVCALVVALMAGASAFAGERARNSLPVLLAAPFPARTLIRGKLIAGHGLLAVALLPPVGTALVPAVIFLSLEGEGDLLRMLVLYCAEAVCGYYLCFAASLFYGSTLRAGISGMILLAAVNFIPALSHAVFWSLSSRAELMPLIGLVLLVAGAIASGVITLMRREVDARWAFLGRIGAVAFMGGLLNIVGARPYNPWTTGPLWIGAGTLPWFTMAYFLVVGIAVYRLVLERFDDAVGRSP